MYVGTKTPSSLTIMDRRRRSRHRCRRCCSLVVPCHYLGPYQYSQDEGRGRYRHFIIIIIIIIIGSVGRKDNNSPSSSTFSYNNSTNGSNIMSSEVVWTTTSQQQGRRRGGIPAMPHPRQEGGWPGINVTSSRYYLMDRRKSRLPTRHKACPDS